MSKISDSKLKATLGAYFRTGATHVSDETLNRYMRKARQKFPEWLNLILQEKQDKTSSQKNDELEVSDDKVIWKLVTQNQPLSIDDIFNEFKLRSTVSIDIDQYEVDRFKIESWDVTSFEKGISTTVKNYLTDVRFRKKKQALLDYAEDKRQALELCKEFAPKSVKGKLAEVTDGVMLELGIYDLHYGKLSIIDRTGETGSLEGGSMVFRNAIDDLIRRTSGYNIEQIVFPIGNDFLHINNEAGKHPTERKWNTQIISTRYAGKRKRI